MNVIVVCSDTFRYDHLGFLKKHFVKTPNLDRLAAESASFADFWLCSFPTLVNRIEVFTGRYTFPFFNWGPLPRQFPVLSEVFKRNGFTTALLADNPHMMKDSLGFGRGFDFVQDVPGQMNDKFQPKGAPMIPLPCPAQKLGSTPKRVDQYRRNAYWYQQQGTNTTATLFREAMSWFESPPEKFFVWIDAFDPHQPWDAPVEFLKPYPWNQKGDAVVWPKEGFASQYSDADVENMRSLYKAEITQVDHWLGRLLDKLREKKLLDRTAILFLSDHGTYFGEHGLICKPVKFGKVRAIYEELGHIPLLFRHPNGVAAGQTIRGLAQPTDIFPTVLELAGIPRVPWIQGNSLLPRLKGESSPQRFAVGGYHPHRGKTSCVTVWTDEWCFVYSPTKGLEGSELYDSVKDPTQTSNVIADHLDVARRLFDLLGKWMDDLGVSGARKQQLLQDAPFTRADRLKYKLWLWRNVCSHWQKYRNYARAN
jgi:arylsulfatase A-like enzyme